MIDMHVKAVCCLIKHDRKIERSYMSFLQYYRAKLSNHLSKIPRYMWFIWFYFQCFYPRAYDVLSMFSKTYLHKSKIHEKTAICHQMTFATYENKLKCKKWIQRLILRISFFHFFCVNCKCQLMICWGSSWGTT